MKYNKIFTPILKGVKSYLDSYIDFVSTWLHLKIFHPNIRNLAPKYSKLLTSHHDSLKSKGHLYPYPFVSFSLVEECSIVSHVQYSITYIHLYAILVSPHSLIKRTTNLYNIQQPTLDTLLFYNYVSFGHKRFLRTTW